MRPHVESVRSCTTASRDSGLTGLATLTTPSGPPSAVTHTRLESVAEARSASSPPASAGCRARRGSPRWSPPTRSRAAVAAMRERVRRRARASSRSRAAKRRYSRGDAPRPRLPSHVIPQGGMEPSLARARPDLQRRSSDAPLQRAGAVPPRSERTLRQGSESGDPEADVPVATRLARKLAWLCQDPRSH
jgi:hypothetical protein